ncbi:hypothetical protein C9374_003551 [Naegleria lovaniensis]|uniref:Uncharacterized protein n=1 Tax=Naegleria lovaniensis TaxID=51637 RepID=A0AA88KS45_NAELO|nr:uncharacterized protein C9374_003551 [Naegleria lovaniensis]KAG2393787.1 hypothetical protein C9374_003551 [Naegleria lovaniensis]
MQIPLVVAPTELIIRPPCDKSDNTIEGLLDESGDFGCSTTFVNKPCIELKFDKVYHFSHLECNENKRYGNDQQRVRGTDVSYRVNETDSWKEIFSFRDGYGLQKVNLNVQARYWKFDCFGNKEIAFGKLRMYAFDAPAVNIKTKAGMIIQETTAGSSSSDTAAVDINEPLYTSGEMNVIAPTEMKLSSKDSWGDNTIEGLLDDTGKFGACTGTGNNQNIVLTYDRVHLFTFLEYKACRLGESVQWQFLKDTQVQYKVHVDDEWTVLDTIEKSDVKTHPESMFIYFPQPVKARYWRLLKLDTAGVFFGMLRLFGYSPYVAIKTKSGVVQPYVATPPPSQTSAATVVVTTTTTVQQPVVVPQSQPQRQQPVVVVPQTVPVVASNVVVQSSVSSNVPVSTPQQDSLEPKYPDSEEVNVVPPTELKMSSKDSWGKNNIEGLLDDSGQHGCCTGNSANSFIELMYDAVYIFTFLEFKASRLGESMQLSSLDGANVQYKLKATDEWTTLTTIERSQIKLNPQFNSIKFDTPIKARYWRVFRAKSDHLFLGMLRLFGHCPYVPIKTISGVVLSLKETLAMWEPKYTGPDVNLVPVQSLESKGESRRENTLEGLLDDSGDYGYVTASHHTSIILNYAHVYLFTYLEYMTLTTTNNKDYYLKDVNIEYRLKESDSWTLLKTIEQKDIKFTPLVNTITFDKPIKAKQWRLFTKGQCIEIGMLRIFGYTPYVPIQTKSGIVPSMEEVAEQSKLKFPDCDQINLIKPVTLYTTEHKKVEEGVIDEILQGSGNGFVTDNSSLPQCEVCFDGIYKFTLFTWREHPKHKEYIIEDGRGRKETSSLDGVKIEYKLRSRDPWKTSSIRFTKLETNVQNVYMVFMEGLEARYFRFTKTPQSGLTSRIGFGMLRCYAYAPLLQFNIKNKEHSETIMKIERKDHAEIPKIVPTSDEEPYYNESSCSEVNVIAPIRIISSKHGKQSENSIEGVIDDSGSKGYSTTHQVHSYIVLEFEAVFLFKYLEFMKHQQISFTDSVQSALTLSYKVKESDPWTRCETFDKKYYNHPKLNVMQFKSAGIKAKYWKFERLCGDISFGMLQFFGVAPFVPYTTTKGLLLSRAQQEAPHLAPYKGSEVNAILPSSISISNEYDETINNKLLPTYDNSMAENTLEGLMDDTAEYGVCCKGSTLIMNFEHIHFFKYLEYYTHCLYDGEDQEYYSSFVSVFYKIRPNEPWIPFHKKIENSKRYPYLNRFEIDNSSTGFKARYWKLVADSSSLLLGTLRIYGYASYEPIPTRTGTVLPQDGDVEKYKLQARLKLLEKQNATKHCKTCHEDLEEEVDSVMECATCEIGLCERDAKVHKKKNPSHEVIERVVVPLEEPSATPQPSQQESSVTKPTSTKDLQNLISYYAKVVADKFTPITTGMGPLQQLNNDPNLLVNYTDEGTSCVRINGPAMKTFEERCNTFVVNQGAKSVAFEAYFLTFTNTSSTPMSVTNLQMEYLDHDQTWKPMQETQAAYWQAATVARAVNFGRELVIEKSDSHGKYVYCNNFNVAAGATSCEYKVAASFPLIGEVAHSDRSVRMLPISMPYPFTVRLTITDSLMQKRSLKLVYATPNIPHQTPEQFKQSMRLRDEDFFVECSDNVNREQAYVGVKLDGDGLVLFNSGTKAPNPQKFTLLDLKFQYEKRRQNSILLWTANGAFCNAEFHLLCDPEFYHKGYAIMVKASSGTNTIERVYPLYEIIKSMSAQRLKK